MLKQLLQQQGIECLLVMGRVANVTKHRSAVARHALEIKHRVALLLKLAQDFRLA